MDMYSNGTLDNQRDLIERWFKKSQNDDNFFDKFISLWISFNAFYASPNRKLTEKKQLEDFENTFKMKFFEIASSSTQVEVFFNFKTYINEKETNKGFIQDLRYPVEKERRKKRYMNIASLCEFLSCVYQIRCNLFHGGKELSDGQDQEIVRLAYEALFVFLESIYCEKNIILINVAHQ